jgi:hypothetical protein
MRKVDNKTIFKIEKRQDFYKKFRMLLGSMGFPGVETWHYDPAFNREFPIGKLVNFVDTFKNKSCEIDLVFTQDRILIILRSSEAVRKKFLDELTKFCEWFEKKRRIEPLRKNF